MNDGIKAILETIKEVHYGRRTPEDVPAYMRQIFIEFPKILEYLDKNYVGTKDNLEEERSNHPATPWEILGLHFYGLSKSDPVYLDLSRSIYEHWYNHQVEFEMNQTQRTIHKGTSLHQLGLIWQDKGDYERARKYLLLALIEDILESLRSPERGGAKHQGYRVLKTSFRLTDAQFDLISKVAEKTTDRRFPEEILRKLQEGSERIPTWEEITNEEMDKVYLTVIYNGIPKAENGGTAFENFAEKFLSSVRGFFVMPGVNQAMSGSKHKEHDYDRILRNKSTLFSEFGPYILIECKYWNEKVDYGEIAKLIYKSITRRCKTGILFAKSGVNDEKYNQTIRDAYLAHNVAILVVTEDDIKEILSCKRNLNTTLIDKYEEVKFHI